MFNLDFNNQDPEVIRVKLVTRELTGYEKPKTMKEALKLLVQAKVQELCALCPG